MDSDHGDFSDHGTSVFLHELEEDINSWIEKTIRVVGTQLSTETAIIEQYLNHSKHRLIVDTRSVEDTSRDCSGDMVELIGKLTWDDIPGPGVTSRYSQLPPEFQAKYISKQRVPVIRAYIMRNAQGINMTLYQEVIKLRRQFDLDFNALMEDEGYEVIHVDEVDEVDDA
ncbi:461_t:CDS:2 [Dentiscutata erythropus]|uniref:461_t:CDS:1 n=1 Tax=Dentiscutata erythropus TaxID=1348616 RepID=A0A9N9NM69_9GLOM|nr:461_t:CDS:2 [Dentiscutata erythropus]